jgi:hypothetical protein
MRRRRRRLPRILLNAATATSLFLCAAAVGLWVRSYWRTDSIVIGMPGEVERPGDHGPLSLTVGVVSSRGAIVLTRVEDETRLRMDVPIPPSPTFWISAYDSPRPWRVERGWQTHRWEGYAGFFSGSEYDSGSGGSSEMQYFALPYWCPVLILTLLASPMLTRFRRRDRPGLCPTCGYDLRATPDRCPECGTAPKETLISN